MPQRRRFTLQQKAKILGEQDRLRLTNGEVCRRYEIQNNMVHRWRLSLERGRFISKTKKSVSTGRPSIYSEHEEAIREFVIQRRSVLAVVNIRSIISKLVELCPDAALKTYKSKQMWAYRFVARNRFSIRRITRNVYLSDVELERRRTMFFREVEQQHARNQATVFVNMDQVSVVYGDAGRLTIDIRGATSVQTRTGSSQADRTTVALSVASNGEKLQPFVIFKGTRNGRVAREFVRRENPYPSEICYETNQNAWITEEAMLEWIRLVLRPFVLSSRAENICLVLDSFSVHLRDSVRSAIRDLNIPIIYIPGGLTCELQPLDVGVNAPFKHYIHEATINNADFVAMTASEKRHLIARSILFAYSSISSDTVVNSFNHMLFTTFENMEDADEIEI